MNSNLLPKMLDDSLRRELAMAALAIDLYRYLTPEQITFGNAPTVHDAQALLAIHDLDVKLTAKIEENRAWSATTILDGPIVKKDFQTRIQFLEDERKTLNGDNAPERTTCL